VPLMLEQGGGQILVTASAAGLLTILGNAPYALTKHAAVALAEWLAITYGDQGLRVSCLCPEFVRTDMLASAGEPLTTAACVVEPEEVADLVVEGLRDERFLILPHPQVAEYFRRKADDYDRWLHDWRRHDFAMPNNAGQGRKKQRRIESLWVNWKGQRPLTMFLVYGDPGSGKTTFLSTFPKPLLVFSFDPFGKELPYLRMGHVVDAMDERGTPVRQVFSVLKKVA